MHATETEIPSGYLNVNHLVIMSLLNTIPGQKTGNYTGATSRHKAESRHSAVVLFHEAKHRLLDINNWGRLCGNEGAEFRLTDEKGELLSEPAPVVGNLIRIKLPVGTGKRVNVIKWLRIEKFEHTKDLLKDEELFGFCVKPISNPLDHFKKSSNNSYTTAETNSFLICREGSLLTALEYDINDMPSADTASLFSKLKSYIMAAWVMTGLANPQWKKLLNGIIKPTFTYA